MPAADRPAFGKVFHDAKTEVEQAAAQEAAPKKPTKSGPMFDLLPGVDVPIGSRHPLLHTMQEIGQIFNRLGFSFVDGPEIEDPFHNFVALNIPEDHPARDPSDNYYIDPTRLVRSQTSTVQIRVMEKNKPPIRVISMGRVYRPDKPDETHSPMFHQIEGLMVGKGITMAHLKTTLRQFTRVYLGQNVRIRFRPSFFPLPSRVSKST